MHNDRQKVNECSQSPPPQLVSKIHSFFTSAETDMTSTEACEECVTDAEANQDGAGTVQIWCERSINSVSF